MNALPHLDCDRLLHHADGGDLSVDEVLHLAACEHCRHQLAELAEFEAAVATHTPIAPADRLRAAAGVQAALARGTRLSRGRATMVAAAMAAAALLLVGWLWWSGPAPGAVLVRERPDPTRAGTLERWHVECELPAGSWPLLWAESADGSLQQLLPHPDPLLGYLGATPPLPGGRQRLPGSALFDFEFESAALPRALLVAAGDREWTAAERSAFAAELTAAPPATRADLLQRRLPCGWRLAVESR